MKIIKKSDVDLEKVENWSIWTCDVSEFDWYYDSEEHCYFLEGEVIVRTEDGEEVEIKKGDYVIFPKGLACRWIVKKPVKKHYNFF